MDIECFVLDFDGTFTDVEREAVPFVEAYKQQLAERFGTELADAWGEAQQRIRSRPQDHGWEYGGHVVAPADSDPYVRATVTANLLFDERGLMSDPHERNALLQELYARNYRKAHAVFRPEAKDVIQRLLRIGKPVYVVSNSDTTAVQSKIDQLAPAGKQQLRVRGNAKKYAVTEPERSDARFDGLPRHRVLPGLERPLLLRRGHYYEVLRDIWVETDTGPDRTLVVGDIYELDLALPGELGAPIHLLARPTTPHHERRAAEGHPSGTVSEDLHGLAERLGL